MDIVTIRSDGNYSHLYLLESEKVTISKKLKDIESLLPQDIFVRVHHSTVINLIYVDKFMNDDSACIVLTTGEQIKVSRRKKKDLLDRFVKI